MQPLWSIFFLIEIESFTFNGKVSIYDFILYLWQVNSERSNKKIPTILGANHVWTKRDIANFIPKSDFYANSDVYIAHE